MLTVYDMDGCRSGTKVFKFLVRGFCGAIVHMTVKEKHYNPREQSNRVEHPFFFVAYLSILAFFKVSLK